jgi:hypothetical protein
MGWNAAVTLDTMYVMETDPDRRALVGELVRNAIAGKGQQFQDAAVDMRMSLSTLYRLMDGQPVQLLQYRRAETHVGLPFRLIDLILAGDADRIRDVPGLSDSMRYDILTRLGDQQSMQSRRRRRTD